MPELNFDNPTVREETLNIAKYYLDLGVDGFRFDAVKYIYYGDTARSVEFWQWYMQELRKIKPDVYCVGECWSGDTEILEYYTAMNCFNFATSQAEGVMASAARGLTIGKYTNYIASMQEAISGKNPDSMLMPFLSNHDMDRIAGSFVTENNMRMAANLCLLSPGSPVIYYGEEIGMRGSRGGANTDANRRLAMLWGDGDTVRNPTGTNYPSDKQIATTVTSQLEDEASLLRYYCKLLTIRHKYPAIARGSYTALDWGNRKFGGFIITWEGEEILLLHNTSTEELTVDFAKVKALEGKLPTQILECIGGGFANMEGTVLTLGGQSSVLVK
jgi:glycosidase